MIVYSDELCHHGIKGQRHGVRNYQNKDGSLTPAGKARYQKRAYKSTGVRSAMAKRSNQKVDKSFDDWKVNDTKKKDAIELGKKANIDRMEYEMNRSDKQAKKKYKQSKKEYKKALKENTTYRKGNIEQEVGRDISRKYLSAAKKVSKQLDNDPNNKELQKQYNRLMSQHDVEREKARRAPAAAQRRSARKAAMKGQATRAVKATGKAAATAAAVYALQQYADKNNLDIDINSVINSMNTASNYYNKTKYYMGY